MARTYKIACTIVCCTLTHIPTRIKQHFSSVFGFIPVFQKRLFFFSARSHYRPSRCRRREQKGNRENTLPGRFCWRCFGELGGLWAKEGGVAVKRSMLPILVPAGDTLSHPLFKHGAVALPKRNETIETDWNLTQSTPTQPNPTNPTKPHPTQSDRTQPNPTQQPNPQRKSYSYTKTKPMSSSTARTVQDSYS